MPEGPAFLHAHAITRCGTQINYNQADSARLDIRASGSYMQWLNMYNKNVKGNTPLELAVVLGASSAVLAHLNRRFPDLATMARASKRPVFARENNGGHVGFVCGGNPTSSGLLKSWNSTQNAIMSHLDGINGIATCLRRIESDPVPRI